MEVITKLDCCDITELESLLLKDRQMIPVAYAALRPFTQEQISLFCHKHAIYQIITFELLEFLSTETLDSGSDQGHTIEIGAGNGCLGRSLGIPITDSCLQDVLEIKVQYLMLGQPTITYPGDIIKIDANKAINKFKPDIVIGSWINARQLSSMHTIAGKHGVFEREFAGRIKKYIHIGNELSHSDKDILKLFPYTEHKAEWLLSRTMSRDKNVIYIFNCEQ